MRTARSNRFPNSLLGAALRYIDNHRVALLAIPRRRRLAIDNGIVERLHRRPAIGRRNYLFAGSHAGAERAAIAYSVCATCSAQHQPVEILADVLPRLARGVSEQELVALTPTAWKAARAPAKAAAA